MKNRLLVAVLMLQIVIMGNAADLKLWYNRPADYWVEAIPLGNGRLGAMMYGDCKSDTIQLNEDTFWSGSPYQNVNKNAKSNLPLIRQYLNEGNYVEAQKNALNNIIADKNITSHGQVYESIGNLILDFPGHEYKNSDYVVLDSVTLMV